MVYGPGRLIARVTGARSSEFPTTEPSMMAPAAATAPMASKISTAMKRTTITLTTWSVVDQVMGGVRRAFTSTARWYEK